MMWILCYNICAYIKNGIAVPFWSFNLPLAVKKYIEKQGLSSAMFALPIYNGEIFGKCSI